MGHRIALVLAAAGALALAGARTAAAGGKTQGMGTIVCTFTGRAKFKPTLISGGTSTSVTTKLKGALASCSGTGDGNTIASGKLKAVITNSVLNANDCVVFAGGLPVFDATIKWKGTTKLEASTVHFVSPLGFGAGPNNSLATGFTGTMDTAGSFPGQTVSMALNADETVTDYLNACMPPAKGVKKIHFTGVNALSGLTTVP